MIGLHKARPLSVDHAGPLVQKCSRCTVLRSLGGGVCALCLPGHHLSPTRMPMTGTIWPVASRARQH